MTRKSILSIIICCFALICSALAGTIGVGKALQITIKGVPAEDQAGFDGLYTVADNGTINLPEIGNVRAAGLSASALQSLIESRYRSAEIYTNPIVQVIDTAESGAVNQQVVYVGGQVRKSGAIPWARGLTLLNAIQAAGGPTEYGSMKRVKILRDGKQKQYDVTKPQFMTIPIQPNDTITVPQKTWTGG